MLHIKKNKLVLISIVLLSIILSTCSTEWRSGGSGNGQPKHHHKWNGGTGK